MFRVSSASHKEDDKRENVSEVADILEDWSSPRSLVEGHWGAADSGVKVKRHECEERFETMTPSKSMVFRQSESRKFGEPRPGSAKL